MSWGQRFATGSRALLLSGYQEAMVRPMFEPWGGLLLAAVALEPGESVLDIACGPGTVTRLAAARVGPSGRVVGSDLSPAMLVIAHDKGPVADGAPIEYVEAPADRLPVDHDRPWGMPGSDELRELVEEAGFADVDVRPQTLPVVFDDGAPQLIATPLGGALAPEVIALARISASG